MNSNFVSSCQSIAEDAMDQEDYAGPVEPDPDAAVEPGGGEEALEYEDGESTYALDNNHIEQGRCWKLNYLVFKKRILSKQPKSLFTIKKDRTFLEYIRQNEITRKE